MAKKPKKVYWRKREKLKSVNSVKYVQSIKGGIGIPQLIKYYEAFQITQVINFIWTEEIPDWVEMERD